MRKDLSNNFKNDLELELPKNSRKKNISSYRKEIANLKKELTDSKKKISSIEDESSVDKSKLTWRLSKIEEFRTHEGILYDEIHTLNVELEKLKTNNKPCETCDAYEAATAGLMAENRIYKSENSIYRSENACLEKENGILKKQFLDSVERNKKEKRKFKKLVSALRRQKQNLINKVREEQLAVLKKQLQVDKLICCLFKS